MTFKRKIGRCLICRQLGRPLPKSETDCDDSVMNEIHSSWATNCIDSVCTLIKIPKGHPFRHFFLNASYCKDCIQLIRDIDFSLQQINNFQKQILGFRQDLFTKFGENFEAVPDLEEHKTSQTDSAGTKRRFSFDEVVKMVYEKIEEESKGWTGTDFIEIKEGKNKKIVRIRNVLDVVKMEVPDDDDDDYNEPMEFHKEEEMKKEYNDSITTRPRRKRKKVSYKEEESKSIVAIEEEPLVEDGSKKIPQDMDLNEDNDPDWRCSDAESEVMENQEDYDPEFVFGPNTSARIKGSKERDKEFLCKISSCGRGFDLESALLAHNRKVHEGDPKPHHCELCDAKYRYSASLASHMNRHRNPMISCSECNRVYTSEHNLKLHMARIHNILFKCKFCGMDFQKQEQLDEHESTHKNSEKPFSCTVCDEIFTNSTTLKQHMFTHADNRPMCDVCGKRFQTAVSLKHHRKIHDESYVGFQCTVCDWKFRSPGILAQHMNSHSDEKKFVCDVCGLAFKYSSGLKLHKRKHDGDFKFVCQICGKGFIGAHYLKNHEEIHSGTLSYECKICGKKFRGKNNLRQHEKIHEPKDPNKKKRTRLRPNPKIDLLEADAAGPSDRVNEVINKLKLSSQSKKVKVKGHRASTKYRNASSSECESEEYYDYSMEQESKRSNYVPNHQYGLQSNIVQNQRIPQYPSSSTQLQPDYYSSMPHLASQSLIQSTSRNPDNSGRNFLFSYTPLQ